MGIELPDQLASDGDDDFLVIPEAWPAVELFIKVQTQWRAGGSGIIGLDYNAVRWLMDLSETKDQMQMLEDLQVIEAKVIERLNSQTE